MKTSRLINQGISLLLAAMLLMVTGVRSWSGNGDSFEKNQSHKSQLADFAKKGGHDAGSTEEAKVSTLSLDAVVTQAISFDFTHYFYFLPQPDWHFAIAEQVVGFTYQESSFLFSYFSRIFGRFIVTNAP